MTTVFANGPIHTMTGESAEWVAVDGDRITAVGTGGAPTGERVDLDGRTLVPGFQDAHIHAQWGGMAMLRCSLHELSSLDEFIPAIKAYADAHPDEEWISGSGFAMHEVPNGIARAEWIDAVVPDRPVYIDSSEGHAGWANSKALELAGITADTPDPDDGTIERDPDGTPNGMLQEGAAFLVMRLIPKATMDEELTAARLAQEYLNSLGITGFQDAWVSPRLHAVYRSMAEEGTLTTWVRGSLWWDRERGLEQLDELIDRSHGGVGRYSARTIKLMVDGVCENGSAWMREPFLDSGERGTAFIPREILMEVVPRIMAAGIQPHFHAIGDAAIGDSLDAVEAGDPADVAATRPHIAHIQVMHPDDIARFAALDVTANAQTLWACNDGTMKDLTAPRLGAERTAWQYPFRAILDSGARMACGSDWSVSTPDVFHQMGVAVNRRLPGTTDAFMPEQAITPYESLHGFTVGSAYVMHRDRSGALREGFEADLAILFDDPLTSDDLESIEVHETYVSGELVWGGDSKP